MNAMMESRLDFYSSYIVYSEEPLICLICLIKLEVKPIYLNNYSTSNKYELIDFTHNLIGPRLVGYLRLIRRENRREKQLKGTFPGFRLDIWPPCEDINVNYNLDKQV